MIYNKISGSSVNSYTASLFRQFDNEECYLAFAKSEDTWGMSALISISLPPTVSTSNVLNSFVDRNSGSKYTGEDSTTVRIYKTNSTVAAFDPDVKNYNSLTDSDIMDVNLYLEYINSTWCVIKNLPSNYRDFLSNADGDQFYIVAQPNNVYSEHPSSVDNIVKINVKSSTDFSTISEPVTLCLCTLDIDPNTKQRKSIAYMEGITKSVTMLGETFYTGLSDSMFSLSKESTDAQYANENMAPTGYYFYFANSRNAKVSENLYMVPRINPDSTRSIFQYEGSGEERKFMLFKMSRHIGIASTSSDFFVKVGFSSPPNELAIYHETLPFIYPTVDSSNTISDANPPGLDITYLTNSSIHTSLVDVQGYVKIKKNVIDTSNAIFSKVQYVKEIMSTVEKNKYTKLGFTTNTSDPRHIETITMSTATAESRYGNARPKPDGSEYTVNDYRLYLWSTNMVVGDHVILKDNVHSAEPSIVHRVVSGVDYEQGYVIFGNVGDSTPHTLGIKIIPTIDDSVLNEKSQMVSDPSKTVNVIDFAVCTDMKDALMIGMENVMVDMQIPATDTADLFSGRYRQIAIVSNPKYYDVASDSIFNCVDSDQSSFADTVYTKMYCPSSHSYETGPVLYIANKNPVYRKYITSRETFKLII